jgi:hypothetical protein
VARTPQDDSSHERSRYLTNGSPLEQGFSDLSGAVIPDRKKGDCAQRQQRDQRKRVREMDLTTAVALCWNCEATSTTRRALTDAR